MAELRVCPECGMELPANAPEGLCPRCLLKAGRDDVGATFAIQIRCPHCHNPIEVVHDAPVANITCPSCDSKFSLLGDHTVTYQSDEARTIGHFDLLESVGMGGFGTVWKAHDTELDRTVAVKIPRRSQLSPAETEQFLREARAAAQLNHPNIVSVHEVGREGDTIYIVSDFVEGITLADWLTAQQVTPREAAQLCAKVANALHHAHQAGVVHRDLKPSNIMLERVGRPESRVESQSGSDANSLNAQPSTLDFIPYIMDFGLAKREAGEITMTVEGKVLGTPAYMSPEQARGEAHLADARSDVYSLGVILFELLTGERPFRGSSRMLLHQVLHDEAPNPRKLNGDTPPDLETICLKCLEKEPGRRYATAQELAEDFQRFLGGKPIQARPITSAARAWRWCKRKPALAGLWAVASVLVLTLSIGGPLVALNQAENSRKQIELRRQKEGLLYVSQIGLAQHAWEDGNVRHARDVLDACQCNLRGWEHDYLYTLFNKNQKTFFGHSGEVRSVAFSSDGKRIVSGDDDGTLKVWDAQSGQETLTLKGHVGRVLSVAFSPDSKRIVSGSSDKTLKVWDAQSGQETLTLKGHAHAVLSVAFSPDGKHIVSGSWDETLKVWDAQSGQETLTLKGHTSYVASVAFSPDGKRIVSGSGDKTLKVWDAQSGQVALTLKGHAYLVYSVAFSPDSKHIVSGIGQLGTRGEIKVWDAQSGQETLTPKGHSLGVSSVAFSPDGKHIVSGSWDQTLKVWDAQSGQETLTLKGHTSYVASVAFSPDSKRIVSGSYDTTLKVWDAQSGQETLTLMGHASYVTSVAFSPDGKHIVSGAADGTLKVWDAQTGQETLTVKGHAFPVSSVAFSPDGKRIVSGDDKTLKVWDAQSGQETLTLKGHAGVVRSVAFSPDGKRIVSGSWDKTLKVWDAQRATPKPGNGSSAEATRRR